eukprot:15035557-Ditylum_brightwellii.AAC.1
MFGESVLISWGSGSSSSNSSAGSILPPNSFSLSSTSLPLLPPPPPPSTPRDNFYSPSLVVTYLQGNGDTEEKKRTNYEEEEEGSYNQMERTINMNKAITTATLSSCSVASIDEKEKVDSALYVLHYPTFPMEQKGTNNVVEETAKKHHCDLEVDTLSPTASLQKQQACSNDSINAHNNHFCNRDTTIR